MHPKKGVIDETYVHNEIIQNNPNFRSGGFKLGTKNRGNSFFEENITSQNQVKERLSSINNDQQYSSDDDAGSAGFADHSNIDEF